MARTSIDICNRALARVGAADISSLDDESDEARAASREWDETLIAALTAPGGRPFRWSFATSQAALTRLQDTPVARYAYAWQIPPEALVIHAVLVEDVPIEFARLDDMIYCDADEDVIAEYTFKASPGSLSAPFVEAVTYELAAKFAMTLREDSALAERMQQAAANAWAGARSSDSQARTSRRIRANRLRIRRFG